MIQLLNSEHIAAHVSHNLRLFKESGQEGDHVFSPYETHHKHDLASMHNDYTQGMARAPQEPGWLRVWGVIDGSEVRGDLTLRGGRVPSGLHRALLSMGIERTHRRQGHGQKLIMDALTWAKANHISWIDLYVFAHNIPARHLYQKMGFTPIGTTSDLFRVNGVQVDDIHMVKKL